LQTREFRSVVDAVSELQRCFIRNEFSRDDYLQDPNTLGAYLLYYWMLHYQEGISLINEIPTTPRRVLDLGSGPGSFAFAALRHGASEVIAIDQSKLALTMASEVCGRYGLPVQFRQQNVLRFPYPVEGKFDLIIAGHCLGELFPESKKNWKELQKEWVKNLVQYLTPEGMILFVENSLLPMNHRVLALRDELVAAGFPIQAPCVWKGECPALQANSLCFAQREFEKTYLMKEIQRGADIHLSSLKMSYLIVKNPNSEWPALPSYPVYRVISPPIDTHVGKRFHLCGTDGKKDLGSRLREMTKETKAFDYLKRGELISVADVVEKNQHIDLVQGSKIKIEAALQKPLPYY
jgi:SAM-dependent methyltransferase